MTATKPDDYAALVARLRSLPVDWKHAPTCDEAAAAIESLLARVQAAELDLSQAATDVLGERERQKSAEGWTLEHDDEHVNGELAAAGACYAYAASLKTEALIAHKAAEGNLRHGVVSAFALMWPRGWKMTIKGARRNLVRSGALIIAEIERLDRAAIAQSNHE